MPMASSGRFQVRLGTWRGPGLACRGRSACWADGAALVQGGSSPDAVLPGRQPVGQAGSRTAQPWQIALAALIWDRPASPATIGENSSGSAR